MKKIAIVTITDGQNYGNRLQNYAVQEKFRKLNFLSETLINKSSYDEMSFIKKILFRVKRIIKFILYPFKSYIEMKRIKNFKKFNQTYINFSKYKISNKIDKIDKAVNTNYEFCCCGSDQIWNPSYISNGKANFLEFFPEEKRIAFAPSFGTNNVPEKRKEEIRNWLSNIPYLSVREDAGKKIIKELTGRTDVEVLVDPTMLLTAKEWDKVAKKPEQLKTDKYILNYFLGELSEQRKNEINKIAKENDCEVINILDKNSPLYQTGPSEFLYLEKKAFLICTDSFHSSVFAILYNRPFIVFEREDKTVSMNSRIETLLSKFKLKNRKFEGKITKENLEHDYEEAYKILEFERKKSENFLKRALYEEN